jgi:hypothetical protein
VDAREQEAPAAAPDPEGTANGSDERDDEARALFERGDQSYAEGDYPGAVTAFAAAHALSRRPELLFNAANALERWGCYADAAQYLTRYASALASGERQSVDRRIVVLRGRRSQADPGVPACPTEPGPMTTDSASPLDDGATAAHPAAPAAPIGTTAASADAPRSDGDGARNALGYSLLGVSAVGLGAGLFFGLSSLSDTGKVEDRCLGSGVCPSSASAALEGSESSALAADVSYGVGLLALGVGLYVLLSGEPTGSVEVSATFGPGRGGLTMQGSF